MKYYQNRTTGEIIGAKNMREVIIEPTEESAKLGWVDYHFMVVADVIHPNKLLGNGIISYCMPVYLIKKWYKRIDKYKALRRYPIFQQYRFDDLSKVSQEERLTILHNQKW